VEFAANPETYPQSAAQTGARRWNDMLTARPAREKCVTASRDDLSQLDSLMLD